MSPSRRRNEMWKRDEAVRPTSGQPATPAAAASTQPVTTPAAVQPDVRRIERDIVNIGKSVVIKGELNGSEDLTIEGHVEGRIELKDHVLTIGPNGRSRHRSLRRPSSCWVKSTATLPLRRRSTSRRWLGGWRHHLPARRDCRGCALPWQRRHAAQRCAAGGRSLPRARSLRRRRLRQRRRLRSASSGGALARSV